MKIVHSNKRMEETKTTIVTPFQVSASNKGIDYEKLSRDFGASLIDQKLIDRVERLTGKRAHVLLRRGVFYSHRNLEMILDRFEQGKPFYLYTGRGPSSESLHIGHLVPFLFTKYLQDAFGAILVIQLTDDEKFFFKDMDLDETYRLGIENAKDIIACGFDAKRTFIFRNLDYMGTLYKNVCKIQKCETLNQECGVFGFLNAHRKMRDVIEQYKDKKIQDSDFIKQIVELGELDAKESETLNVGKIAFPAIQCAPAFSSSFPHLFKEKDQIPCLVPCAIDQDPYFRMTRDVAHKLGFLKPALIHSKFIPGLGGPSSKMSASDASSAIYISDTPKQIATKINKSFSGGQATKEEQERLGANVSVDVACQYLTFFMEDDEKLAQILKDYAAGKLLSGQVKKILIDLLQPMIAQIQQVRSKISSQVLDEFMNFNS